MLRTPAKFGGIAAPLLGNPESPRAVAEKYKIFGMYKLNGAQYLLALWLHDDNLVDDLALLMPLR